MWVYILSAGAWEAGGTASLWRWVLGRGCWELGLGSLKEQYMPLAIALSLQPKERFCVSLLTISIFPSGSLR